jgi:hypothetical protein
MSQGAVTSGISRNAGEIAVRPAFFLVPNVTFGFERAQNREHCVVSQFGLELLAYFSDRRGTVIPEIPEPVTSLQHFPKLTAHPHYIVIAHRRK